MALLSADDVLNKSFQTTKFRDGYDQDEVDDFLDEVVGTLRAVYAENDELKAKLAAAESRVAELSEGGTSGDTAASVAVAAPTVAPVVDAVPEAPATVAPAVEPSTPESATGMLALAQKLHDEYVSQGKEESDRIVAEARSTGESIVREAETTRDETLKQLETERGSLERKIDELRTFEREYRQRLKSYLEGLLSDVASKGNTAEN